MANSIITTKGKIAILNQYSTILASSKFKVGTGADTPNIANTDLDNPVPIENTEQVDSADVADWSDSADMTTTVNTSSKIEGTGSLNLTKDGTGSADASTEKTIASPIDFTSKELSLFLRVVDSTALAKLAASNAITIRFGSDSGNYFEWLKDDSDLTAGVFNFLGGLTTANANSTVGSPVTTALDFIFVQLTATGSGVTWSAGDFNMDDIQVASSGDFLKDIESSFPVVDETNIEITSRYRLPTIAANGHILNGFGIFDNNTDMISEDKFDGESKSDTDEFIFETKDRIE